MITQPIARGLVESSKANSDMFQIRDKLTKRRGQAANVDLGGSHGERERWIDHLQSRFGLTREEAERELTAIQKRYNGHS